MDAAQMLTAQEIARQCEQLARSEAAREDASSSGRRRHLRLVEPVTEPIPIVTDPPKAASRATEEVVSDEVSWGAAWPEAATSSRAGTSEDASNSGVSSAEGRSVGDGSSSTPAWERLGDREWEILAFERQWWKHPGAKEKAIRELFDMSSSRYYQLLNAVVDKPAALEADPMLVKRLRKVRASRQRARRARRLGIEWH